jgi:hypothetical protein
LQKVEVKEKKKAKVDKVIKKDDFSPSPLDE